jgi:DNA-directed RNA polymerase subunit RPC12/RpoP
MRHCVRCGDGFLLTNRYRGNYCPDCHSAWLGRAKSTDAAETERRPRLFARRSRRRDSRERHRERTGREE